MYNPCVMVFEKSKLISILDAENTCMFWYTNLMLKFVMYPFCFTDMQAENLLSWKMQN